MHAKGAWRSRYTEPSVNGPCALGMLALTEKSGGLEAMTGVRYLGAPMAHETFEAATSSMVFFTENSALLIKKHQYTRSK
jgi:hypothetical protein